MSKATIQMCMSTTGFGPQALRGLAQAQQYPAPPSSHSPTTTYTSDADARSDTDMQGYSARPGNNYFAQPQSRRPAPRFDMNLKDLFSDDETDKRSFSRVSNQVNAMRPPPLPIKHEPQSHQQQALQPFTADLKISPQLRTNQTDPSSSQQQPFFTSPNFSPPLSQTSPYQISNQLPYTTFAQNINSTYPDIGGFSDLDFLDSFPVQGSSGGQADAAGMQDVGIGFGMGFGDGSHDWSDGNGFDLFDGFFFGPGGTGG
jgi:hypothetical protein